MSPFVSVIIPVFNAYPKLRETLDCVCQQTLSDLEVIVVDYGSSDSTVELVLTYPDTRVRLTRIKNRGICAARNVGLVKASGQYIQFLDPHDLLDCDKIARQVEELRLAQDPTAIAYGPWWSFLNDAPLARGASYTAGRSFSPPMEWLFASMEEGFDLPSHCWLLSREVACAAGEWDECLLQNQDGDYFSRVLEVATQVLWVPDAQSYSGQVPVDPMYDEAGSMRIQSLIGAADKIRDRMIAYIGYNPDRRRIISALYLRILYKIDGADLEIVDQIWQRIHGLGLPNGRTRFGGVRFDVLKRHMGWKLAFKMKQLTGN